MSTTYDAELVVLSGRTVYHWVDGTVAHGTLQVGGQGLDRRRRAPACRSVSDLRQSRRRGQQPGCAAGVDPGPAAAARRHRGPRGALNLGGTANLTTPGPDGVLAWDLGPANALIDAAVGWLTDGAETFDRDGVRAARGAVRDDLLAVLLDEPYYALPAPKSTGKELFHLPYLRERVGRIGEVAPDDLVATCTELTARLVARDSSGLDELVVAGGGTRNPVLMSRIAALAPDLTVTTMDEFGLPSQAKESFLFALLGFLTWHGLPGIAPGATGARHVSVLGSITPGREPLRLPEPATVTPHRLTLRAR